MDENIVPLELPLHFVVLFLFYKVSFFHILSGLYIVKLLGVNVTEYVCVFLGSRVRPYAMNGGGAFGAEGF